MICIPKQNGTARKLSFILILGGILIWILSSLEIALRGVAQLTAIVVIVVGVQVMVRYVLSEFKYVIDDDYDGTSDFIVYRRQGTRSAKVCHISLNKIEAVFKLDTVSDYQEKYGKVSNRFNYCQNPGKNLAYVLLFYDGDKLIEVRFEPDENFVGELRSRMQTGGGDSVGFLM